MGLPVRSDRASGAFRPSRLSTAVLWGLILCFIGLGNWQLHRADEKEQRVRAFEQAPSYSSLPDRDQVSRYSEVDLQGHFDTRRHLLVDNQLLNGRPGIHVLTPFELDDGRWILVNRGWLPLAPDRRTLPPIPTPGDLMVLSGKLDEIYRPGTRIGPADRLEKDAWPQLLTYPEIEGIGDALEVALYPLVLLLDRQHPAGFEGRDWKPVNTGAAKHRARAMQWFTFAVAAVVIWLFLAIRRGNEI